MPCRKIRTGKGLAIICSRTKPKQCFYCDGLSDFQCDFPTVRYKSGRKKGKWRTCDKHLCRIHAKSGISKNVEEVIMENITESIQQSLYGKSSNPFDIQNIDDDDFQQGYSTGENSGEDYAEFHDAWENKYRSLPKKRWTNWKRGWHSARLSREIERSVRIG